MGGGGMYNTGCYCTPNLTNCTFSGNWTRYAGGGIYNAYSNPTMTNCILWGNSGEQIHNEASSPTVSYSDIQGGYGDTGNIDDDPCFVDPNGPDGEIGTEDDNLRLSTESPCIDTGDPNYSDANYPTDLDGRDRFVDGDCNDTVIVDMGAYEFTSAYYGDFDGDCDVDFIDYAIQANYWLTDGFLVDIAPTPAGDGVIDEKDLAILCINWLVGTEP